jgi:hypothetical protein
MSSRPLEVDRALEREVPVEFSTSQPAARVSIVEYDPGTIFVTGVAKVAKDDPIASSYQVFFVSLVVDQESGGIVDATCNTARDMTKDFIRSILVGGNLASGVEELSDQIRRRFFGMAQKPLLVALKDAHNRFMVVKRTEIPCKP